MAGKSHIILEVTMERKQNLHSLLKAIFWTYAIDLRPKYPSQTIRNADVCDSAIRKFSRLGYIELVDCSRGIPPEVPSILVRRLKRVRYHPIWIMGSKFPDDPMAIFDQMRPSMKANKIVWHHRPSRRKPTWRTRQISAPAV